MAEDNADDVLLIQMAYANAGIRQHLQVVANGLEAIRYLSGEGPYADRTAHPLPMLLLLDLKMPERDGFDVLQWLRQHPSLQSGLRTIILTGNLSPEVQARARDLGACSVVEKSFAFAELQASLQQLKETWLEPASPPQPSRQIRQQS